MRLSQRGAVSLPVVIAAVLGLGFGASAFLNVAQHQRAEQDKKLLRGEITDLRYQVTQDKLAANSSPTPSPEAIPEASASPSPSPSATPAVLDASTAAKTATIKTARNIHADASTSSPVVVRYTQYAAGISVNLGSILRDGWQQVTVNGKTGFIEAKYLSY